METLQGKCFKKGMMSYAGYWEEVVEGEKQNAALVAYSRATSMLDVFRSQFLQDRGTLPGAQAVMSMLFS